MNLRCAVLTGALLVLSACTQSGSEPASTPLPTKQTTIDPVMKKLDNAAQDIERRRQSADDVAK
jgi:hypothetical protein